MYTTNYFYKRFFLLLNTVFNRYHILICNFQFNAIVHYYTVTIMSKRIIFVTGATGNVGSYTIRSLNTSKDHIIAGVKTKAKVAEKLQGKEIDIREINFADKHGLVAAFKNIQRILIIPPGKEQNRSELTINAIHAAKEAGVRFVLLFSTLSCERGDITIDNQFRPSEEALMNSGMEYSIIQAPYFQENILGMTQGIYLPLRDGYIPMISVRDLGDVCAHILQAEDINIYKGKTYKMTGPENLTGHQMAEALSKAINKPIKYVDINPEEFKKSLIEKGVADWHAKAICELIERYAKKQDSVTDNYKQVMGKQAMTFAQLCSMSSAQLH